MNLFHIYKAKTVLHIMLYSTLKIMFKRTNYYKALKKNSSGRLFYYFHYKQVKFRIFNV